MNYLATFFLSTGRCGTQWFGENLKRIYEDMAIVDHEKFQFEYRPRENFRRHHLQQEPLISDEVETHLAQIEKALANKHYIETGWTCFGLLPVFRERFGERFRLVHLYRQPEEVALSFVTHCLYERKEWTQAMCLFPWDAGAYDPELDESRWEALSAYEKNLFRVIEMNEYAHRLMASLDDGCHYTVKYEDFFYTKESIVAEKLLEFLGLPYRAELTAAKGKRTDKCRLYSESALCKTSEFTFRKLAPLKRTLGYDEAFIPSQKHVKRYCGTKWRKWWHTLGLALAGYKYWITEMIKGCRLWHKAPR